jgi:beta-lactamase regulating signal transducer with metallopeptidase domain
MQTIPSLLPASLAEAFGWMVLHSLWQAVAIAFLAAVALLLLRNRPAMFRYKVAKFALFGILVAAALTFCFYYDPQPGTGLEEAGQNRPDTSAVFSQTTENQTDGLINPPSSLLSAATWSEYFSPHLPLIVLLWFAGMSVFLLRLLGNFGYVFYLQKHLSFPVESYWEEVLQGLAKRAGVRRSVELLESALIQTPLMAGYLKPVILFPMGMINRLDPAEAEAILAHELGHILHHDYLWNLLQSLVETLFYFHPAVWWLSAKIRQEREMAADDAAIRLTGNPLAYAKTLVSVQEMAFARAAGTAAFAFAGARKSQLFHRIQHILNVKSPKNFNMEKMVGTLAVVLVLLGLGYSQSYQIPTLHQQLAQMTTTGGYSGVWQAEIKGDKLCLTLSRRYENGSWTSGDCFPKSEFSVLPTTEGEFTMTRPAGKVTFTGKFEGNEGYGKFTFAPDQSFANWLALQGISGVDDDVMFHLFFANTDQAYVNSLKQAGYTKIEADDLVSMAIHEVTMEKINAYNRLAQRLGDGKPSIDDMVNLSIHEVTPDYAEQLENIGFKNLDLDDVMNYKIHDITPQFVKYCSDMGFPNLSPDDVLNFKIHDITPEYLQELKKAGLTNLSADEVLTMKIQGVTPETVGKFRSMGFGDLSHDEILSLQIHEITPEFLAEMSRLGFENLDADEAMNLKIHEVDANYIADLKKAGFTDLDMDEVVNCKIHEVDAAYVAELKKAGLSDLGLDEVVTCKIHDVTPAHIKGFEQLGFQNISVDDAVNLRIHGVTPDFIKKMQEKGFKDLDPDEYVELKIRFGDKLK